MIRTTPQAADIGLTSLQGPAGALIRAGQFLNGDGFASYEHAFVVLPASRLIEARPGGARIAPLTTYDQRNVLFVSPAGLTYAQRVHIAASAAGYEGVPYSALDYAALAAHRFHLPVPGLRRYVASTGHMICSQLADQAYADAGVQLFADGRWPGYVTPGALFELLARDDAHEGVAR